MVNWGDAQQTGLISICVEHRYRKYLNSLLKVCYVPATRAVLIAFFSSIFAAAFNSTYEANKVAIMQSIYLDVYGVESPKVSKASSSTIDI
jgi:hypothetical protein